MKTIKKVSVSFEEHGDYLPEALSDSIVHISKEFEVAVHNCLCGCGIPTVTPLNKDGWSVDISNGKLTMKPSILNRVCGSHYIITNGVANFC